MTGSDSESAPFHERDPACRECCDVRIEVVKCLCVVLLGHIRDSQRSCGLLRNFRTMFSPCPSGLKHCRSHDRPLAERNEASCEASVLGHTARDRL